MKSWPNAITICMRICLVSSFPTPNDGVSDYTRDLLAGLQARGEDALSVKIDFQWSVHLRRMYSQTLRQILELQPEVVHIQYTPSSLGPGIGWLIKKLHAHQLPVMVTVHEKPDFFIDRLPRWCIKQFLLWERRVLRLADCLIVHTQDHFVDLRIRYDIPGERIQVIPHFLQDRLATGQTDDLRLVALGRIVPKKRLDLIIEALPELRRQFPNVKLLVIGQAPARYAQFEQDLKSMAEQLQVQDIITWAGYVPNEQLASVLSPQDIGLLPYVLATQSGAALKLLGFHVPLITSALPAFQELMTQYEVGVASPLVSGKDIIQALQVIKNQPEILKKWKVNISRLIQDQSLDTIAQRHIISYQQLCQKK